MRKGQESHQSISPYIGPNQRPVAEPLDWPSQAHLEWREALTGQPWPWYLRPENYAAVRVSDGRFFVQVPDDVPDDEREAFIAAMPALARESIGQWVQSPDRCHWMFAEGRSAEKGSRHPQHSTTVLTCRLCRAPGRISILVPFDELRAAAERAIAAAGWRTSAAHPYDHGKPGHLCPACAHLAVAS